MRPLWLLITFLILTRLQAQEDTTYLSLAEVLELASAYHPIVRQAGLQDQMAQAELRTARGQFDPKLQSQYNLKNYHGTEYYNKFYNNFKIPTWFPIDPKVEVYRNSGEYLNPENYVSGSQDYWQVTAGVSLPLGKGLFIDERRSMVKQARLYAGLAEAEKIKLINKTLLTISKAYWDWYLAYEKYVLMAKSLTIAEEIYRRVQIDYTYGEAAVVDTVQAKITYQTRLTDYEKAKLERIQAALLLSVHLWAANDTPLELDTLVAPEPESQTILVPEEQALGTLMDWAAANHPEIQKLGTKRSQLEVEQQWNKESLKPEINLSYSLIDAPFSTDGLESPDWTDSYKLGIDFSFPVFLRKERGKLQKTRVYQEQTDLEITQTRQEIIANLKSTFEGLKTNQILARQYQQMADGYSALFQAEVFNLEAGESDLFKLNIQQDKYISSQIKALEVTVKYEKLKYQLPYDAGLPFLSYQKMYE